MNVQYIFHSGFLLETSKCCYIFDYYLGEVPKFNLDKPVVVLCSHGHQDHYNPEIFSILQARGVKDVFAVLARDISEKKYPAHVSVLKAYAGQNRVQHPIAWDRSFLSISGARLPASALTMRVR